LHEGDCREAGFEWLDPGDADQSVVSFMRRSVSSKEAIVAVFNYTPVPRFNCRIGSPTGGVWSEILNSDAKEYGGSGRGNLGEVETAPLNGLNRPYTLILALPPMGALLLKCVGPQAGWPPQGRPRRSGRSKAARRPWRPEPLGRPISEW